jgi:chaperonin GroEL (HSP60 family)
MPDEMSNLKIAILTKPLDIKPLELIARNEGSPNKLLNMTRDGDIHKFKDEEYRLRKQIVEQIKKAGANVVFCRSKIDDRIAHLLCQDDIFASSMVDEKQLDEIAKATGANIIADASLLTSQDIGHGEKLEIEKLGPDQITIVHTRNNAASLLLRASNPEILQELEKIVKKSLLILKHVRSNAKIVPGGGAIFEMLSVQLRKFATTFPSRQQLAINTFAYALEKIPEAIARNYGLDPIKTVFELRKEHANGKNTMGIGESGPMDMINMDIVELASVNKATLRRALEVVSLLLRVDSIFQVKELPVFHKQ